MSTGFRGKFHRQNTLSRFAKDLVRRSRSHCELCNKSGVKLETYELLPHEEEPHIDGCIFVCEGCFRQLENPAKIIPSHWRCLNNALYSEIAAVQVASVRILRHLTKGGHHWAEELLEHAYLEPNIEEWSLMAD